MTTSPIIELKNTLLLDENYIKFEEIYKNENIIDKDLLVKLLNRHHDLYYTFLKINLFIYRFDIKGLNSDLKDFKHYKGKVYYIDDLDCVLRFYYSNYTRNQRVFKIQVTKNYTIKCFLLDNEKKEILIQIQENQEIKKDDK